MRRLAALVMVCGCSDDALVELDAAEVDAQAGDAQPNDGATDATEAACIVGQPTTGPRAGTYCLTWMRIDGPDAFPRYYDTAEVTLSGVTWRTEGGKEYASSATAGSCLTVAAFVAGGGRSEPLELCWSSPNRACGEMTWKQSPLADGHWSVVLDACQ
jgi:hypothetical protein